MALSPETILISRARALADDIETRIDTALRVDFGSPGSDTGYCVINLDSNTVRVVLIGCEICDVVRPLITNLYLSVGWLSCEVQHLVGKSVVLLSYGPNILETHAAHDDEPGFVP